MTVTVGFSRASSKVAVLSKLIMLFERTNYSHAYIKVRSDSLDRTLIYQATGSGVFFWGEESFLTHSTPVEEYRFSLDDDERRSLLRWCVDNSGKPYGKKQILGFAIQRAFAVLGIKIKNIFADRAQSYICCELVAVALKEKGFMPQENQDDIGLKELRERVRKLT